MQSVTEVLAFPRGSRVIHIGPPKTGTTAVQSALFRRRADLASHGVAYPGRRRHERAAVSSVAFEEAPPGYSEGIERRWQRLTREIRESTADRILLSSEAFSYAPDSRLPRIIEDLGGMGLQVVVTARPLVSIMPSRWQQSVQNFQVASYDEWLRRLFAPGASEDPQFAPLWRRLRIDQLVRRWGAHVGEENVTLIVLDPTDHSMLLASFEKLLGLPGGYLAPASVKRNVSLPYPEVEMLRAFNGRFRAEGHSHAMYVRAIRKRAMRQIKATGQPMMKSSPIYTPTWAVERADAVARSMVDAIAQSGARVIGDLRHLVPPVPDEEPGGPPTTVDVESAAEIAYAMFVAGRGSARPRKRASTQRLLDQAAGRDLARELLRRVRHRVRR